MRFRRAQHRILLASGSEGEMFPVFQFFPVSINGALQTSRNVRNSFVLTDTLFTRRGKHSLRAVGQAVGGEIRFGHSIRRAIFVWDRAH